MKQIFRKIVLNDTNWESASRAREWEWWKYPTVCWEKTHDVYLTSVQRPRRGKDSNRKFVCSGIASIALRVACSHFASTMKTTNERTWENIFFISHRWLFDAEPLLSTTLTFSLILFTTWQTPCGFILILMRFSCSCSALLNKLTKWNFCIRNVLQIQTYSYKLMYIGMNAAWCERVRDSKTFSFFCSSSSRFPRCYLLPSPILNNNNNRHKSRRRCVVAGVAFLIATRSDVREYCVGVAEPSTVRSFFVALLLCSENVGRCRCKSISVDWCS